MNLTDRLTCSVINGHIACPITTTAHIIYFHVLELCLVIKIIIDIFNVEVDIFNSTYINSCIYVNPSAINVRIAERCVVRLDFQEKWRSWNWPKPSFIVLKQYLDSVLTSFKQGHVKNIGSIRCKDITFVCLRRLRNHIQICERCPTFLTKIQAYVNSAKPRDDGPGST